MAKAPATTDYPLMMEIGSTAAESYDTSIRIDGNLLHDFAQIALAGKNDSPARQLSYATDVTNTAADLLDAWTW
jgi:hypothetical protein